MLRSPDIDFLDSFICPLCIQPLSYKPIDAIDDAEIGECPCANSFCARAINGIHSANNGIPIRDMVITFPDHKWSIMIPCHGTKTSWGATPINEDILSMFWDTKASPLARLVFCSNSSFKWLIKLDDIPEFFSNPKSIDDIINHLNNLLPFA